MNEERPVIKMDLDGNFIAEYKSLRDAAKSIGGTTSKYYSIYYACNVRPVYHAKKPQGKSSVTNGFKWKWKEA